MIDLKTVLKPDINQYLLGVPDYVLDRAIVDGTRRFLNDSQTWTERQKLFVGSDSVIVYPNDPANTDIVAITEVKTMDGMPCNFTYKAGRLFIKHQLDTDVFVTLSLANKKANSIAEVPDWVYSQYVDALIHSSVDFIKLQSSKPWFDPQGASYHYTEYRKYLGEALIEMTPKRVEMNPFV